MPQEDDVEGFHPRRHRPTKDTRDYVFAVLPGVDLPQSVSCAVRIESRAYLAATGGTCDRFMLSETLTTLPPWLKEVSPGLFHSEQSTMFASMILKGLQMEASNALLRAAAPEAAKAKRDAWVDPTDEYLSMFEGSGLTREDVENMAGDVPFSCDPKDYIFAAVTEDDGEERYTRVYMVDRAYHEAEGGIRDQEIAVRGLPDHLDQEMESHFRTDRSVAEVRAELEALGMTHHAPLAREAAAEFGSNPVEPSRKASDYVYSVGTDDVPGYGPCTVVALVERRFFEENGHMDDVHVSEHLKGLPKCMEEIEEGSFVSTTSPGELCMLLESMGIRSSPALDEFLKGVGGPRP